MFEQEMAKRVWYKGRHIGFIVLFRDEQDVWGWYYKPQRSAIAPKMGNRGYKTREAALVAAMSRILDYFIQERSLDAWHLKFSEIL